MNRYLILALFLLSQTPRLSAQGNWDVYFTDIDSATTATIGVDLALIKKAPMKEFPYLIILDAPYKKGALGFPANNAELDRLYRLDHTIAIDLSLKEIDHYLHVGSANIDGYRMYYFYGRDTAYFFQQLKKIETELTNNQVTARIDYDAEWETYKTFLYPPEKTLRSMHNRRSLELLQKEGDDLSKARRVDHWIYFSSSEDRDKFKKAIANDGFSIEKEEFDQGYDKPYHLQIYRTDAIDQKNIDRLNEYLVQKAKETNGEYDGWETTVVE